MKKIIWFKLTLALCVSLSGLDYCLAKENIIYTGILAKPAVEEEISSVKIGFAGTVELSSIGKDVLNGVKIGIEDAAQFEFKINGKKTDIKLYAKDDSGSRDGAIEVANWMVHRQDLVAVIGHISSGLSIATGPIYDQGSVALLSPTASSPAFIPGEGTMRLRLSISDAQQGKAMGRYLIKTMGSKKPMLVVQNTAYARGIAEEVEAQIKREGIDFTVKFEVSDKQMDFMKQIGEIKAASTKADSIVLIGFGEDITPFAKSLREHGVGYAMLVSDGVCTEKFLKDMMDSLSYICAKGGVSMDNLLKWPGFIDRYKLAYGSTPSLDAAKGYDAVMVVMAAVKSAESIDPKVVFRTMKTMGVLGITGEVSFDGLGNQKKGTVSFYQGRNGGWFFDSQVETSSF